MATTDDSKKSSIISLADEIKRSKQKSKETDLSQDVKELQSLIDILKKEREKNTVTSKLTKSVSAKMDKATNPTTYLRAVMPKFFETFHENLNTYDKERKASIALEKMQAETRKKELKELQSSLDEFVAGSKTLGEIANRFGKNAARQEALMQQEAKELQKAESEYLKNMDTISDRLKSINDDARSQWAKEKGIQLVKIVDDEPTREGLEKLKNEISKQIEADAQKYDTERLEAKKKATDDRRNKEAMLKEQSWFRKFWGNKKEDKKDTSGGFLAQLLGAWAIENLIPALLKAGLVAGLIAGIVEYFSNEEFKAKVDKLIEMIDQKIVTPMFEALKPKLELAWENFKVWLIDKMKAHWEWVLLGLALAFPTATLTLIGVALKGLVAAIQWATKKILQSTGGTPLPDIDTPDKKPKDGNSPDKKSERARRQPRNKDGTFKKGGGVKPGMPKGSMLSKAGPWGALLTVLGIDAAMDYDDDMQWALLSELEGSPFYDKITDDEEDKFMQLVENKEYNKASDYLNDELAAKYHYKREKNFLGMRSKEWKPITSTTPSLPVSKFDSPAVVGPTPMFTQQQYAMGQMGFGNGSPVINAPTVNTNNSSNQTFVMPKTAVDPSRSIMFQKP